MNILSRSESLSFNVYACLSGSCIKSIKFNPEVLWSQVSQDKTGVQKRTVGHRMVAHVDLGFGTVWFFGSKTQNQNHGPKVNRKRSQSGRDRQACAEKREVFYWLFFHSVPPFASRCGIIVAYEFILWRFAEFRNLNFLFLWTSHSEKTSNCIDKLFT